MSIDESFAGSITAAKYALNSTIGASMQPLDEIISDNIDSASSAVISAVNNKSVIKSIQRGTFSITSSSTTISINSVNAAKSFVLINDSHNTDQGGYCGCFLQSMTSTSITIKTAIANQPYIGSWQVIEFY